MDFIDNSLIMDELNGNSLDYESDVLESENSESENEENIIHSESEDSEIGSVKDDETYIRFVQSVFCDDEFTRNNSLLGDEEDDEEFIPTDDKNDEEEDDEEDDDSGFLRVAKREIQDLIDGCWQTIVGEENTGSRLGLVDSQSIGASEGGSTLESKVDDNTASTMPKTRSPLRIHQKSMIRPNSPLSKSATSASIIPSHYGHSLISSVVSQMFSDDNPKEISIDGMPIDAIRKLAARQMSMTVQLLLQLLLIVDENSITFNKCYNHLVELSNYREKAIKKYNLLEINVQNVRSYQQAMKSKISNMSVVDVLNYAKTHDGDEDSNFSDLSCDEENSKHRRLTRAEISRLTYKRTTSVIDLPVLENMPKLFELIDAARKSIKQQKLADDDNETSLHPNSTKIQIFQLMNSHIRSILSKTRMKYWNCLVPKHDYPLGEQMWLNFDSSSLIGRSKFTPAEDDLLLRGLITLPIIQSNNTINSRENKKDSNHIKEIEYQWNKLKEQYLPSKEEQSIQFRYSQMTSSSSSNIDFQESSRFKIFFKLSELYNDKYFNRSNYVASSSSEIASLKSKISTTSTLASRMQSKWTDYEYINLLRGFQVYGDKWHLISIFFLPHRHRKEIKKRWLQLANISMRKSDTNYRTLTPELEVYLRNIDKFASKKSSNAALNSFSWSDFENISDDIEEDVLGDDEDITIDTVQKKSSLYGYDTNDIEEDDLDDNTDMKRNDRFEIENTSKKVKINEEQEALQQIYSYYQTQNKAVENEKNQERQFIHPLPPPITHNLGAAINMNYYHMPSQHNFNQTQTARNLAPSIVDNQPFVHFSEDTNFTNVTKMLDEYTTASKNDETGNQASMSLANNRDNAAKIVYKGLFASVMKHSQV